MRAELVIEFPRQEALVIEPGNDGKRATMEHEALLKESKSSTPTAGAPPTDPSAARAALADPLWGGAREGEHHRGNA